MTIEDMIRQIVREEIARQQRAPIVPRVEAPLGWVDAREDAQKRCLVCDRADFLTCGRPHCPMRPPFVAYQTLPPDMATIKATLYDTGAGPYERGSFTISTGGAVTYTPPEGKRMGCTCPPGAQTSCPDATCPWKPA